jgi:hypothetical protein
MVVLWPLPRAYAPNHSYRRRQRYSEVDTNDSPEFGAD